MSPERWSEENTHKIPQAKTPFYKDVFVVFLTVISYKVDIRPSVDERLHNFGGGVARSVVQGGELVPGKKQFG